MIHKLVLAGALLLLHATPATAQSYPAADPAGAATSMDHEQPGSLSPRDVAGKRLLDADGAAMGTIEGVSGDGRFAILRPVGGGKRTKIAMSGLSIGMSSHTVTANLNSSASGLNARNAAKPAPIAAPVQPGPPTSRSSSTVTTTTTQVQ